MENLKKRCAIIRKSLSTGKIRILENGCFSVPSYFFLMGITPSLVKKVSEEMK